MMRSKKHIWFCFSNLRIIYETTIQSKKMNKDPKQLQIIDQLQTLNNQLINAHPSWQRFARSLIDQAPPVYQDMSTKQQKQVRKKNFFNFFSKQFSTSASTCRVKGLYLYGGSGCGKSFISDIFYQNLSIQQKRKVHFHEFMAQIHGQLFQLQKQKKGFDPLFLVAKKTAKKTRLLYLDQFQVTDVADASILKRLFEQLFNNQLVLLATSNRKPQNLYKSGHQRQFFLPFIDFLQQRCHVSQLNSLKDYRYDMQKDENPLSRSYFTPIDEVSDQQITRVIKSLSLSQQHLFQEEILQPVPGRKLKIPRSKNQVCVYYFHQLFDSVMGDADFRAICKSYKAIIIKQMKIIKRNERNMANRLIKLFDEAYFRNVKIYITGEVGLNQIINAHDQKTAVTQQDFALIRCKSRLMEFQTKQYKERLSFVQEKIKFYQQN